MQCPLVQRFYGKVSTVESLHCKPVRHLFQPLFQNNIPFFFNLLGNICSLSVNLAS